MQCPNPTTRKHKGKLLTHNCGKCIACKINKQSEWITRWTKEMKKAETAIFTTLTIAPENEELCEYIDRETGEIEYHATITKQRHQKYLKRLRKQDAKNHKLYPLAKDWPKIKYHSVGDYGELTLRPHYHDVIINLHPKTIANLQKAWSIKTYSNKKQPIGNVTVKPLNQSRIRYVISHNWKSIRLPLNKAQTPPFTHMSRNIGMDYVNKNKDMHKKANLKHMQDTEGIRAMPTIYKTKIFGKSTEHQKLKNRYEFDKLREEFEQKHGITYEENQQNKRDNMERRMARKKKTII